MLVLPSEHSDSFARLERPRTSHAHDMSSNTDQGTNANPTSLGSSMGSSDAQARGPQTSHPTAGGSAPTTGANPTIGGSTPTFGAATTMKALPAQTWHKVPLNNSSDDFSHWSETMRLALNNQAPWPMADGLKPQADIRQRNLKHSRLIDSKASCITHSHRSRHCPSSLANPTKITLGENSNIPAVSTGRILIRVHASRQRTCAVLQDILYVPDSRGSSLSVPHLLQQHSEALNLYTMRMEVNDSTPAEITTQSTRNAKATIPALTANRLEISGGSTTSGPCDPCLKGKQTREEIRRTMVTCADCALDNVFSDARKLLATQTQNGHKYLVTLQVPCHSRQQQLSQSLHPRTTRQFTSWTGTQGLYPSGTTINWANSRGALSRHRW